MLYFFKLLRGLLWTLCLSSLLPGTVLWAADYAWQAEANTTQFEVLLKSPLLTAGKTATLDLFLADFASNQPVQQASVSVQFADGPEARFEAVSPGVYRSKVRFENLKTSSAIVSIRSPQKNDLIILEDIPLAQTQLKATADTPAAASETGSESAYSPLLGLLVIPLIVLLWWGLKRHRATSALLILASLLGNWRLPGLSHEGGHDIIPTEVQNASVGAPIEIEKSMQFEAGIRTVLAAEGRISQQIETTGQVEVNPQYQAIIQAPIGGAIQARRLPLMGDHVQAGQLLFHIAEPLPAQQRLELQVRQLELSQNQSAVQLDLKLNARQIELASEAENLAQQNLLRIQALEKLIARKELPAAELALKMAQQNLEATLAERQRLQNKQAQLEKTRSLYQQGQHSQERLHAVYAPISGHIDLSTLRAGQQVKPGDTLIEIHQLAKVWVKAQIYEKDLALLGPLQAVNMIARAYPGQSFSGKLHHVLDRLDSDSQTLEALFEVENPNALLKIGMNLSVQLPLANTSEETLLVPRSAVYERGGQSWIFVLTSAEKFIQRQVELGPVRGDQQSIRSGLAAGERVAVSQVHTLYTQSLTGGQP